MKFVSKTTALMASGAMFIALAGPAMAQKTDQSVNIRPLNVDSTNAASTNRIDSKLAKGTSNADVHFAKDAASGGMLEVQLGNLAVQKTSNDQVKKFGQRMANDHSKADEQLKAIAAMDNIQLPDRMDAKDQATYNRLSRLSGTAFDRAYMRNMVKDHQSDIDSFMREANGGQNKELKDFAQATAPTLQSHLQEAQQVESSLGIQSRK